MDRKDALAESQELYRAVVETCPHGIVVTDLDGTIIAANTATAQLHGCESGNALIGRTLVDLVSLDDRRHLEETLGGVLTRGEVRHVECRLLRRAAPFPAEVTLSAVRDDRGAPLAAVAIVRDMTERSRLEARLRYQALHDSLTDLPNRVLLSDRLEHALAVGRRSGTAVSLLLFDLDGFKEVNDRFGHDFGDALLQQVAGRLAGVVRDADTLARLGGDEFAVVVTGDEAAAVRAARRVQEALAAPMTVQRVTVRIGVSIGIARYPADGEDRATLFRLADAAMYAAKRKRTGYEVYLPAFGAVLRQPPVIDFTAQTRTQG